MHIKFQHLPVLEVDWERLFGTEKVVWRWKDQAKKWKRHRVNVHLQWANYTVCAR